MPPVKIKYIVSFTSQDENFKAVNLVSSGGFKKWLSNPKEKSTETAVTLQLEKECSISYIDIGTHWCANIEILVGRSDWPQGRDYESLSPTCIMMTPMDCNLGRNFACTRMFSTKDFNETVAAKSWDRLRIICRRPMKKDVQFGLSFLCVKTTDFITPQKNGNQGSLSDAQKSVKSIQKHFFGKNKASESTKDEVKAKLLKLAGSAENGTEDEGGLSRTAKLVLAAKKGSAGKSKETTPNKSAFYSDMVAQKYGPEFKEEVKIFLASLEIKEDELDKVTIADLRHKLERKKKRKLDKDERKTFAELARNYICALFGESDEDKNEYSSTGKEVNHGNSKGDITQVKKDNLVLSRKQETNVDKQFTKVKSDQIDQKNSHSVKIKDNLNKDDIAEQLRQVRENANRLFRERAEKQQKSNTCTENEMRKTGSSSDQENKDFNILKNSEDNMYKSMTYLERKAFALTNPYKLNKFGNSLRFGPDTCESDDENIDIPSTNDKWLSKVNPSRNDVMFSPPTQGKRKRGLSGSGHGRAPKGARNEEGHNHRTPKRGRGKASVAAKEVMPTSFERCPMCKATFPPWQLSDHKLTCGSPSNVIEVEGASRSPSPSPDIVEVGVSGPSVVDSLRSPEYVECPLCSEFYSSDVIQFHASVCGDVGY